MIPKHYYLVYLLMSLPILGWSQVNNSDSKNSNHQDQPEVNLSEVQRVDALNSIDANTISAFLGEMAQKGLIGEPDVEFVRTSEHVSSISGIKHSYYRQAIGGIEVIGTESSLHVMSDGNKLMAHNKFVRDITGQLQRSAASLNAQAAIQSVAQKMGYGSPTGLEYTQRASGINQKGEFNDGGISQYNIPVRQVYILTDDGVKLAWELSIAELDSSDWWNFLVDAGSGEIIQKQNWTVSCLSDVEHNHADHDHEVIDEAGVRTSSEAFNAPLLPDSYRVYAMPIESPNHGSRTLEVNPHNTTASPYGWHDTDGSAGSESNYTIGNNCDAYDDSTSTVSGTGSGVNSERAYGGVGPALTFDFSLNTTYSGGNRSIDAAVTNLFYWTNIIHDVLYFYGFDETAGNFQENTYGNGGTGGDLVWAEAQDGSGTCNANFATPPDGSNPRMQMYVCGSRDGDLDNAVIIHEYGHGISNRLTGGAANASALTNAEQMGEGWSDYYGLMLTMESGDSRTDARGIGTWLIGEGANGPGIRPAPYSTSTGVNNFTYGDVSNTAAISQPHGIGFIWSTMLWEMTWDLIDLYGFDADFYNGTGGNNIAMNLVTEGLKLQAVSPGFVDGRDAILAADRAMYSGAHECLIWEAFARRGLGYSASQGASTSRTDGVEAFDVPPITLTITENVYCNTEGPVTLGGGVVSGGTYSGPGVTDDGNGSTFTFDPGTAGIGTHIITYNANDCSGTPGSDTTTIQVTDGNPVLSCQDISIDLDPTGTTTIEWSDVVSNSIPGGYTASAGTYAPETFSGTAVSLGDDNGTAALPIGFDFEFYDTTYTEFYIASNGFVSFTGNGMTGVASYTPTTLPTAAAPNGMIAVVWDDLSPNRGGTVQYATLGTAPNRKLVVEYDNVPHYFNGPETVSAQLHLYEGTNRIEVHLIDVQSDGGNRTLGIENAAGDDALPFPGGNLANWTASLYTAVFEPQPDSFAQNCGNSVTVSLDRTSFDCDDVGVIPVTVTADDGNGGVTNCVANVTVNPHATTYSGGSWSDGAPGIGSRAVIGQNYNTSSLGSIDACECEVNGSRTLTVGAGDYLRVQHDLTVNGTLVVEHQGSLVQVDGSGLSTNNGTINVDITTPTLQRADFMVVGSPMTNDLRSGALGGVRKAGYHVPGNFAPNGDVGASVTNFQDEDQDFWQLFTAGSMTRAEGYLVWPVDVDGQTADLTFSGGTLNNGLVTHPLVYNGASNPNGTPNILSNPYASPIDADAFLSANSGISELYFWEHLTAPDPGIPGPYARNFSMDDISLYNSGGGTAAANDGTGILTEPNGVIATAQGFGVRASATGTASFTNAMRLTSGNTTLRQGERNADRMWLRLSSDAYDYPLGSNLLLGFNPEATAGIDAGYDTDRLDSSISLYSQVEGTNKELSIQTREAFNEQMKVSMGMFSYVTESIEYQIALTRAEGINLEGRSIYLVDNLTGVVTNLTETAYRFRADAGDQPGRFTIQFEYEVLSTNDLAADQVGLYPNPTNGNVTILTSGAAIDTVVVFDLLGREVIRVEMNGDASGVIDLSSLVTSVYLVQIQTDVGQVTKRLIKE